MAFTNTWDVTQPPDTQQANLLGQDIRNLKTDVMQRMAGASGVDGAKNTYEAGFAGVLYFATDTGKLYIWNGAAWTDFTSTFLRQSPLKFQVGPVVTNGIGNVFTQNIPAGILKVGSLIRVSQFYSALGATIQFNILGGSSLTFSSGLIYIQTEYMVKSLTVLSATTLYGANGATTGANITTAVADVNANGFSFSVQQNTPGSVSMDQAVTLVYI